MLQFNIHEGYYKSRQNAAQKYTEKSLKNPLRVVQDYQ